MTTFETPGPPIEICVVVGEICPLLLDFRDSCGNSIDLTGALVEFFVWETFADVCEDALIYCSTAPGYGIDPYCPEQGLFILTLVQSDFEHLCVGDFCWKVRVTLPDILLTNTGTAAVTTGSQTVTITGGDVDEIDENTVAYLGSGNANNSGPFLVDQEIIAEPETVLTECCDCGTVQSQPAESVVTGPTGNLVARNASFETESGMAFALYSADYYEPPQMRGPFRVKAC